MHVAKLSTKDVENWSRVGDQEIFVSDLVDAPTAPDAAMTVGYARVGKGERLDISFPYDEVLVVTSGAYAVGEVTARAGEVIYLPAGSSNTAYAIEDTEMVYVASPPSVYAEHVALSAEAG